MASTDIFLHHVDHGAERGVTRSKALAFVPITLALLGVAAILAGGVNAKPAVAIANTIMVDPMITGSITTPHADAIRMLDD